MAQTKVDLMAYGIDSVSAEKTTIKKTDYGDVAFFGVI